MKSSLIQTMTDEENKNVYGLVVHKWRHWNRAEQEVCGFSMEIKWNEGETLTYSIDFLFSDLDWILSSWA